MCAGLRPINFSALAGAQTLLLIGSCVLLTACDTGRMPLGKSPLLCQRPVS